MNTKWQILFLVLTSACWTTLLSLWCSTGNIIYMKKDCIISFHHHWTLCIECLCGSASCCGKSWYLLTDKSITCAWGRASGRLSAKLQVSQYQGFWNCFPSAPSRAICPLPTQKADGMEHIRLPTPCSHPCPPPLHVQGITLDYLFPPNHGVNFPSNGRKRFFILCLLHPIPFSN